MSTKPDGGPAFPNDGRSISWNEPGMGCGRLDVLPNIGMSLRDYFMAHAPITLADVSAMIPNFDLNNGTERGALIAVLAVMRSEYADAMIAERSK